MPEPELVVYATLDQRTLACVLGDGERTPLTSLRMRTWDESSPMDGEKRKLTKAWDDFVDAGSLNSTRLRATKGFKKRRPGVYWMASMARLLREEA